MRGFLAKIFAIVAVLAVAFTIGAPQAHAAYTDVADSYGTVSSVEPLSSALSASEIPEGVYTDCDSRTSSTYFKLYDLSIVVEDGVIIMKASASASYTAIGMGEADEVAAACSADELGGDAVDISHGALFSMQIPALNASFEIAAYSKSREAWYTRTICIDALEGSQVQKAILKAKADAEAGKDDEGEDEAKEGDEGSKTDAEDAEEEAAEKSGSGSKTKKSSRAASTKSEKGSKAASSGNSKSASSGSTSGKTTQSSNGSSSSAKKKSTTKEVSRTDPNYRKFFSGQVRKVSFIGSGMDDAVEVKANSAAEQYVDTNALAVKLVALFCALLLAAGFALRVMLFRTQSSAKHSGNVVR